jgi:carbon monoxide dehydrogenase subunit G
MRIEQQLVFSAPAEQVWGLLADMQGMAECIPGAENVQALDPDHFALRVKVKVGPISVAFDCQVTIVHLDAAAHSGSFEIIGRDSRIGAGVRAVSAFNVTENGQETMVALNTDTDISGKIAQYGHGIIRQRADATLQAFGECVRGHLTQASV